MDQWSKVSLCVCGYFLVYSIDTKDTIGTKNVNKNEFAHSKFLTGTEQNSKELYSKVPIILLKPYEQTKRDDDSDTNKNTNVYENASYRESVMPTGKAAGSSIAGVSEKSAFGNVSIVQKKLEKQMTTLWLCDC